MNKRTTSGIYLVVGLILGILVSFIGITKYTERDVERRERGIEQGQQDAADAKDPTLPVTRAAWKCVALAREYVPQYKGLRDSEVLLRTTRAGLEALAWRDSVEHAGLHDGPAPGRTP